MAVDHAIMDLYPVGRQPTLRFFAWSPPCLSIGIAQRLTDVRLDRCSKRGVDVVRRPTGGRAIFHESEITYSLVTAQTDPLIAAPSVVASYARINAALVARLARLGIAAELAPRPPSDLPKSPICFDVPADYEITVAGRKLVGSAQSRRHAVVLQQGSILLHATPSDLLDLLVVPETLGDDALAHRLVALDALVVPPPQPDAIVAALMAGISTTWAVDLIPGKLSPDEQARAAQLVRERYANPAWTGRR